MLNVQPQWNRRQFLKSSSLFWASLGISVGATGCDSLPFARSKHYQPSSDRIVKTGYLPITDASPLLAAYDKGFYRLEGLEALPPQRYRSWAALSQAFINREVNVVHLLMPLTIWMRYGLNVPGKVVAWNHTNGSAITVLPEIESPYELGGQTIAIPSWYSLHNIILQILLREVGLKTTVKPSHLDLKPDEIRLVVLSPIEMFSALSKRNIAGYIVAEPYNSVAENAGVGKILRLTGDIWKDHGCCVVFMHEEDIIEDRQWTQKVVNAIVKSQRWSRNHRLELAHILSVEGSQYIPYPISVLEQVLTSYDRDYYTRTGAMLHPQWRSHRIDFQPYPFPSYTQSLVQALQQTFINDNTTFLAQLSPDRVALDLVEDSFVKAALEDTKSMEVFGLSTNFSRDEIIQI
ncbi:ABC transporter substrate-binding protein [Roseofilum casamattae]|uniref:ABC transporter substrate-binding protein n=1 Tax=Roseofilum casamattae BLCC-M143 TaxID=3022442 RepID=A0ABT7C0L8_9CYAN|nr:ABC transporter substrate-binding protein [Roseofilum casamattae]MDJ1184995.1 ABC transporter substrate-binding protein [Roseofilum casamattae BLCC-M143]